jgi:hypothetical protein
VAKNNPEDGTGIRSRSVKNPDEIAVGAPQNLKRQNPKLQIKRQTFSAQRGGG